MATVIETTGKTINDAIQAAVAQLGVSESELEVEVLETPTKRLFGLFGETPAKIRATVKEIPIIREVIQPAPVPVPVPTAEPKLEPTPESIPELEPIPEPVNEKPEIEPVLEPSPVEEPAPSERGKIIDEAKNFLQEVFAAMNLEVSIEVEELEDEVKLNLVGKELGILIGRRGQALDALQYVANLAVNRTREEDKLRLILDVENYRHRREVTLKKLAKSVAERAIKTRKEVKLEPMNRHERKIIHTVLQDNDRVETHSVGEEPYRYIIVTPVKRGKK